jgi:hypothetical protein
VDIRNSNVSTEEASRLSKTLKASGLTPAQEKTYNEALKELLNHPEGLKLARGAEKNGVKIKFGQLNDADGNYNDFTNVVTLSPNVLKDIPDDTVDKVKGVKGKFNTLRVLAHELAHASYRNDVKNNPKAEDLVTAETEKGQITMTRKAALEKGYKEERNYDGLVGSFTVANTKTEEVTVELLAAKITNERSGSVVFKTDEERLGYFASLYESHGLNSGQFNNLPAERLQKLGLLDEASVKHIDQLNDKFTDAT